MKCRSFRVGLLAWLLAASVACLMSACDGSDDVAPVISTQPTSVAAALGTPATFSLVAQGNGLSYQWQRSTDNAQTWRDIVGATGASYTTAALDASANGTQFRVIVGSSAGSTTSAVVTLTVGAAALAPSIAAGPADAAVAAGATASFAVTASGTALVYQWQSSVDGIAWLDLGGANSASLTLAGVTVSDNDRRLRVVVSNASGSATSSAARLSVGRPAGFSALASVLATPRADHTATLLPNGLVLIVGGNSGSALGQDHGTTFATAELYNPATQVFTPLAARMAVVREGHTATLLPSGLVLIAGGFDNQGSNISYASAELFNPATGTFTTLTGAMRVARSHHAATLLPNGQVLLAGGDSGGDTAELFDPVAGTFTLLIPRLTVSRAGHSATLLANGQVLLVGGGVRQVDGTVLPRNSAELFDPAARTFTAVAATMSSIRIGHSATLLPSGKVLLTGSFQLSSAALPALDAAELYDPASGTFSALAAVMTSPRAEQSATLLPSGKVLLVGGTTAYGASAVLRSVEVYDPPALTAQNFALLPSRLPAPLAIHAAVRLPDGTVLITGGVNTGALPSPALSAAYIFNPATQRTTALAATMRTRRTNHTATLLPDGQVLIAGGQVTDNDGDGSNSAELYDPQTQVFTSLSSAMVSPRGGHAAVLLPNGKVLLAGGFNAGNGTLVSDAELFDPVTRTFSTTRGRMVAVYTGMAATLMPNGMVLLAGGSDHFVAFKTAQLYDPATQTFSALANTMTARRGGHGAALLPNGKVLLMGGGFSDSDLSAATIHDTAEVFDPATQTFTAITARMSVPRFYSRAVLLGDGTVAVIGGGTKNATSTSWTVYDSIEIFTP